MRPPTINIWMLLQGYILVLRARDRPEVNRPILSRHPLLAVDQEANKAHYSEPLICRCRPQRPLQPSYPAMIS